MRWLINLIIIPLVYRKLELNCTAKRVYVKTHTSNTQYLTVQVSTENVALKTLGVSALLFLLSVILYSSDAKVRDFMFSYQSETYT